MFSRPAETESSVASSTDPILMPYIRAFQANDDKQVQSCLDDLIHQHADPIINATVNRYISGSSARVGREHSDVRAETVLRLLGRLNANGSADGSRAGIRDFRAYVKRTARHVCWNGASKMQNERCESDAGSFCIDDIVQNRVDISLEVTNREYLRAIWKEVSQLPLHQRRALLFNFRGPNGDNGLPLLLGTINKTSADLADILQISMSELIVLLPFLPMENRAIAERLRLSPLEVDNLRTAARRRLQRRLREW